MSFLQLPPTCKCDKKKEHEMRYEISTVLEDDYETTETSYICMTVGIASSCNSDSFSKEEILRKSVSQHTVRVPCVSFSVIDFNGKFR